MSAPKDYAKKYERAVKRALRLRQRLKATKLNNAIEVARLNAELANARKAAKGAKHTISGIHGGAATAIGLAALGTGYFLGKRTEQRKK